jgi:tRNA pseudouridine55 synthase
MNGFLLIDKPAGISSFGVVARVRRALDVEKVGHCGTLDPLATGLLIVCLGKATKLAQFVSKQNKSYSAEITLGFTSTTYDSEGKLTAYESEKIPSEDDIRQALPEFAGDIEQVAPMYSAVKHLGKPLYKYALKNQTVEPKIRNVRIDTINIVSYDYPHLTIDVACSSGTYIRSLAHDLGARLGCGGYISNLRRTEIGKWHVDSALPLTQLVELPTQKTSGNAEMTIFGDAYVAIERMLDLPALCISDPRASEIPNGVPIRSQDIVLGGESIDIGQLVALRTSKGELLAVGRMRFGSANFDRLGDEAVVEYVRVI